MIREIERRAVSGYAALAVFLMMLAAAVYGFVQGAAGQDPKRIVGGLLLFALGIFLMCGLFVINPNEARVLQLFGSYVGSVKQPGLRFANPLYTKRRLSLRVRNFESSHLKVNDIEGNPIEIAAVVVWRVIDTAEASFEVDSYENYVHVQSEAALRNLATSYPYDSHEEAKMSLRGNTAEIAEHLKQEIQERLSKAGVQVIEARISHLAYAAEIASAMLQRQQAGAIIAARQLIVDGAVGMVEMALERLDRQKIVALDGERRAAMVCNLLVVLCGERAAQPVLNTGTLYQ
jgi:regulator of protease activity HflC (stomatin/prohibitin superfamily)